MWGVARGWGRPGACWGVPEGREGHPARAREVWWGARPPPRRMTAAAAETPAAVLRVLQRAVPYGRGARRVAARRAPPRPPPLFLIQVSSFSKSAERPPPSIRPTCINQGQPLLPDASAAPRGASCGGGRCCAARAAHARMPAEQCFKHAKHGGRGQQPNGSGQPAQWPARSSQWRRGAQVGGARGAQRRAAPRNHWCHAPSRHLSVHAPRFRRWPRSRPSSSSPSARRRRARRRRARRRGARRRAARRLPAGERAHSPLSPLRFTPRCVLCRRRRCASDSWRLWCAGRARLLAHARRAEQGGTMWCKMHLL